VSHTHPSFISSCIAAKTLNTTYLLPSITIIRLILIR
jgi:hypothetical protein